MLLRRTGDNEGFILYTFHEANNGEEAEKREAHSRIQPAGGGIRFLCTQIHSDNLGYNISYPKGRGGSAAGWPTRIRFQGSLHQRVFMRKASAAGLELPGTVPALQGIAK